MDYEKGRTVARECYERHQHEAFAASTVSMFELAFGVVWESDRDLATLQQSLQWLDFLELSASDAHRGGAGSGGTAICRGTHFDR